MKCKSPRRKYGAASDELIAAGVPGGVAQAAEICGKHPNTITNWHKESPSMFTVMKYGCAQLLRENEIADRVRREIKNGERK